VRVPVAVGLNVTLMVQTPLATMPVPHVLVSAKSPLVAMPAKVSVALPGLLTVTDWAALVLPTNWPVKVRAVEESEIDGVLAGTVVLVEPPPQQVRTANPATAASARHRFAIE
jgi:hypothetical protein